MNVQFTRSTPHFRRSVNGAWLGDGASSTSFTIDENDVKKYAQGSGDGTVFTVEFSDGAKETGVKDGTYLRAYSDRLGAMLK